MLRVAHVISTPSRIGGAERLVGALVRDGADRGWDQLVLNPFASDPARSSLAEICGDVPVEAIGVSGLTTLPSARRWLAEQLERFQPQILHVHLFHALVLTATVPRLEETRVLTHHYGPMLRRQGRWVEAWFDDLAGRRMDLVVAVSRHVRDFLVEQRGYDAERVVCIRNGWEGRPLPRSEETKRAGRILCVGNLRREKGHDVLIRAFAEVHRDLPGVELVLVGSGPQESHLLELVRRLDLVAAVRFVGPVDDVWPWLAEADVFALASRSETLGIAAIEALAAGVPVVATEVGGLPEVIEDGRTGRLVPPDDPLALAEAIIDLISSPEKRSRMSSQGVQASEGLRVEKTVAAYAALYKRLIR